MRFSSRALATLSIALFCLPARAEAPLFASAEAVLTGNTFAVYQVDKATGKKATLLSGLVLSEAVRYVGTSKEITGRLWILAGSKYDQIAAAGDDLITLKNGEKIKCHVAGIQGGRLRIKTAAGADEFPSRSVIGAASSSIRSFTGLIRSSDWADVANRCAADFRSGKPDADGVYPLRPGFWSSSLMVTLPFFAVSPAPAQLTAVEGAPEDPSSSDDASPEAQAQAQIKPAVTADQCDLDGRSLDCTTALTPPSWRLLTAPAQKAGDEFKGLPDAPSSPDSAAPPSTLPPTPPTPNSFWQQFLTK